jgi:hypothetical protein
MSIRCLRFLSTFLFCSSFVLSAEAQTPNLAEDVRAAVSTTTTTTLSPPVTTTTRPPVTTTTTTRPVPSCAYRLDVSIAAGSGTVSESQAVGSIRSSAPSCITDTISNQYAWCRDVRKVDPTKNVDECAINAFILGNDCGNQSHFPKHSLASSVVCSSTSTYTFPYAGCVGCLTGSIYFDSSCNPITNRSGLSICDAGDTFWKQSPISIILDESNYRDYSYSMVQFKLNPNVNENWHTWKGSSAAPLLVYDPEKTGRVSSGSQLFGNWTFGGKKQSLLNSSVDSQTSEWKHGYEALATLDRNFDGTISGKELDSLSLWFDVNKDAKSQQGEVRPIVDSGIVELYYQPDSSQESERNIYATRGYKQILEGKEVYGRSVDWYADTGLSQQELVQRHASQLENMSSHSSQHSATTPSIPRQGELEDSDEVAAASSQDVSGVWTWSITESNDNLSTNPGMMVFKDLLNGKVLGKSYTENRFMPNADGVSGMMNVLAFEGKKEILADGEVSISFVATSSNGVTTENVIVFDKDLKFASGHSTAKGSPNGRYREVSYNWKASRYMDKK